MKPFRCFGICLVLALAGCQMFSPAWNLSSLRWDALRLRSQTPDEPADEHEFETKVETPMIGDYVTVTGLNLIMLQGVGLVTGLDGTGGDPPPSRYRESLLDDMRKRGVRHPNQILQSPSTALVIVRAYLPPLVDKGERFDVEVSLPSNSEATSLNGGWLLETFLSEKAIVPGRGVMSGHVFAKAKGPVLISTGEGDERSLAGVLRRGRVVGGGISLTHRDMSLYLRNDFQNVRNSQRIARAVGQRFHHYNEAGVKEPVAEAKTDKTIELKILPKYKDNYPRYLQVIRNIPLRETEVGQRLRMKTLEQELNNPPTAEQAALKLEAIGPPAVAVLKDALQNPRLEVRFHAAVALAYLGEQDGLNVLAEAARKEPAFRVFAYAAMATLDDAETHILLRNLMNGDSAETRYGAFRALATLDANDPFIRGEKLNDEFMLHVLDTTGDPLVHLTNRRKAEIVLFGAEQRFVTPMAVRAGNHILVTAQPGSDEVMVSRFAVGEPDRRKTVSTRIADVIRTLAEFGASYPDVAQLLAEADRQYNLPGRIEIDALPQAGRVYVRPAGPDGTEPDSKTEVGNDHLVPNLFAADRKESP